MSRQSDDRVPGSGLLAGLATTLGALGERAVTQQYPDTPPSLPPRSRGVIALLEENCTVCMLCARECPDWCIYIDSHKETVPPKEPGARPRTRNMLDRFAIDFSLCMYCGICIEVCPFDALFWSPEFEYAAFDIADLTHEKDRLGEWMATVPPPPAHEPGAAPAKELTAATSGPSPGPAARPAAAPAAGRVPRPAAARAATAAVGSSAEPTAAPTAEPTAGTSAAPTAEPTAGTSAAPTAEPAAGTSAAPTAEPAAGTSAAPTAEPAAATSAAPTGAPTAGPAAPSEPER